MPVEWARGVFRRWCELPFGWSTYRGGCRKDPGHVGRCAPGRYR